MANPLQAISDILRAEDDFMIVSHYNPDGDAIGSSCAMGHLLSHLDKRFTLYNPSGLPERYDFVALPAPFSNTLPAKLPKWTIVLDCGSDERMGNALLSRTSETSIINIDHHLGNGDFGTVNWVDPKQPAVGQMVALLADFMQVPLVGPLAECLYLAVATDTGFFTYGSTTPESLELAGTLLRSGLDIARMNMLISKQWSTKRMRLLTEVLNSVELFHDEKIGVGGITQDVFARTGTTPEDTENIINFIRRLKTVRVSAILREEQANTFKFSLRSYGDDNVQEIAAQFGGGGHKNAAGGTIEAPFEEARALLVQTIADSLGL